MSYPLITVIVPVYKTEKYLRRCVDSIRTQTYVNLEIILVDDGSPDNSAALCDVLATEDSRIRVIHKENGGLSSARNAGLDVMTGDYVGFVDSDDWVTPDMYQVLYDHMQKENAQISCCGIASTDDTQVLYYFNPDTEQTLSLNTLEALCELTYNFRITNSVCDKLYKAEIFHDLRMRTGILYEDAQVQPYCIAKAQTICYTAKPMYHYYMSPDSILRGAFSLRHKDVLQASKERQAFFAEHYPQALPYAQAAHICVCMDLIFNSRMEAQWDEERKALIRTVRQPLPKSVSSKMLRNSRIKRLLLCIHPGLFTLCIKLRH